jgi:DNA-binding transcriptional LysR family regulator
MARPEGFNPPFRALPIYNERFVIACSAGHPFARQNVVRISELDGQSYLSRINCEFRDVLGETCAANGARLERCYRSEREDWILMMVAAGMGVCFLPEYSATVPGVVPRPVIEPTVERQVCLVMVAGRRWSPPVATFVQAVQRYPWPKPEETR